MGRKARHSLQEHNSQFYSILSEESNVDMCLGTLVIGVSAALR